MFHTVALIDLYSSKVHTTKRSRYQLVGVAAMLCGSREYDLEGIRESDLSFLTDRAYDSNEIIEMARTIADVCRKEDMAPTSFSFLEYYVNAANVDMHMLTFLAELMLQEDTMLDYPNSKIAAAAVYLSRKATKKTPWTERLVQTTGYQEEDIKDCAAAMTRFLQTNQGTEFNAVFLKYRQPRYGRVSTILFEALKDEVVIATTHASI